MVKKFKNKEAYKKWIAYIKIHNIKTKHPYQKIIIHSKEHKVKHRGK